MKRWQFFLLMLTATALSTRLKQPPGMQRAGASAMTAHAARAEEDSRKPTALRGSLRIRWRYHLPADSRFTPGITSGDLDGDGRAEIIVKSRTGAVVLDGSGR